MNKPNRHLKTLFPTDTQPDFISFEYGAPDQSLLPTQLFTNFNVEWTDLQYGPVQGDFDFLSSLEFVKEYGMEMERDNVCVTSGCSQSFWNLLSVFAERDCLILLEDPTYFLACKMIMESGLEYQSIGSLNGFDLVEFERVLVDRVSSDSSDTTDTASRYNNRSKDSNKIKFKTILYLVPTFANPTGLTISHSDRVKLVKLAHQYNVLIICDDVYQFLYFDKPPERLFIYDLEYVKRHGGMGRVVSNQTFSKIVAPGLRLGWIEAEKTLLSVFTSSAFLASGGSVNHFTSCLLTQMIKRNQVQEHIEFVRKEYRKRCDVLCDALEIHLPKECEFKRPKGGYFVWIYIGCNAEKLFEWNQSELKMGRGFRVSATPGSKFSIAGGFKEYLRVSFAMYPVDELQKGAERLGRLIKSFKGLPL